MIFLNPAISIAVEDPLLSSNNRFGIHVISNSKEEVEDASKLVNSNGGDWGYIAFVIEEHDRDKGKWQKYFDELRKNHLIPIVRIATKPVNGGFWEKPTEDDALNWATFLNSLQWPVKNRYVVIYNEPNHAAEWGNQTNPHEYAKVLDQTITELKKASPDFFVINAGLDASTPHEPPTYFDELEYLQQMNSEVPGIFEKLDGWSSHSYPNPGFVGSPYGTGRMSIRGYLWEKQVLKDLGVKKDLPVFITETGWKHSDGLETNRAYPSPETVSGYYQTAFEVAWNDPQVVAVTPFLLNYSQAPFDHFSFKKAIPGSDADVLGLEFPQYHPQFKALQSLKKTAGNPKQSNSALLQSGNFYTAIAINEEYSIPLKFKNTGQSIWDSKNTKLKVLEKSEGIEITGLELPEGKTVEPNQEEVFTIKVKATEIGSQKVRINLTQKDQDFESAPLEFKTEVQPPVLLVIKSGLAWKDSSEGTYTLKVKESLSGGFRQVKLSSEGQSDQINASELLPDYTFEFTLERPYYGSKTIKQYIHSGVNVLDFGDLPPNIPSALSNPGQLWQLLPFSN